MARRKNSPNAEESQVWLFQGADEVAEPASTSEQVDGEAVAWRPSPNSPSVRKPIETVLIRPKEGRVTLLCRRFFNVLLKHAQAHPAPPGQYQSITLSKLIADSEYPSRNLEYVIEVVNHMLATVVNWGDSPKNLKGPRFKWSGAALLAYATIEKLDAGPTTLRYDFHKELREHLLNPQVYAYVSLEMNARLSTHAALALYELGAKYLSNKNGLTMRMAWREWVGPLTGNPNIDEELQYKYFARDVLKPALKEVNETQSDFELTPLVGKVGRRVESLQFMVKRRGQGIAAPARHPEIEVEHLTLLGQLISLKVPQKTAEGFLVDFGPVRVRAALDALETRRQSRTAEPVYNVIGYVRTLLEKGELAGVVDIEAKAPEQPRAPQGDVAASLRADYLASMKREHLRVFLEAPVEHQRGVFSEFEATRLNQLSTPVQRAWSKFKAEWPAKKMTAFVAVPFQEWLFRNEPEPDWTAILHWAAAHGRLLSADAQA